MSSEIYKILSIRKFRILPQCKENEYFNSVGNNCEKCHVTCKTCSDYQKCDSCKNGQYLLRNNYCGQCDSSQTPEKIGQQFMCNKCSSQCNCDSNNKCLSCKDPNLQKEESLNTCIKCDPALYQYLASKDICTKCKLNNCLQCKDANTCEKCIKGYTLKGGVCGTDTCPLGQFKSFSNVCNNCKTNCLICSTSYDCQKCNDNFFLQLEYQNAIPTCQNTCNINEGYYIEDLYCKKCLDNCLICQDQDSCLKCKDEFFLNSNKECKYCHYTCKTCDSPSTKCLTCKDGQIFNENGVCTSCNGGNEYKEQKNNNFICRECSPSLNCFICKDSKNCTTCKQASDYYIEDGGCGYNCETQNGYYILGKQCKKCSMNCKVCDIKTICKICMNNYYLKTNDNSCSDCKMPAYFISSDKKCLECKPELKCLTCDKDKCLTCNNNFYLYEEGKCGECSEKNYYKTSDSKCLKCPEFCETCENDKKCLTCIPDSYFFEDNICRKDCIQNYGYYKENLNCKKCNSTINCKTCQNFNSCDLCLDTFHLHEDTYTCRVCQINSGYYIDGQKCKDCTSNYNCKVCKNSQSCESCQANYYMNKQTNICELCKEEGKFIENNQFCMKCDPVKKCKTCQSFEKCQSCNIGQHIYPSGECDECKLKDGYFIKDSDCKQCSQVLKCQTCSDEISCNDCLKDLFLYSSKKCDECKEEGVFQDKANKKCVECHKTCRTCSNFDEKSCLSCQDVNHLLHEDNTCKPCGDGNGFVANNKKCFRCPLNCKKCNKDQPHECLECFNPYNFIDDGKKTCDICDLKNQQFVDQNGYCKKCHSSCQECSKEGDKSCTKCSGDFSFNPYKGKICEKCDTNNGYFIEKLKNECTLCHNTCKKCSDNSEISCETCAETLSFLEGKCKKCEITDGYYIDKSNKCNKCHPTCQSCEDDGEKSCKLCKSTLSFNYESKCEKCDTSINFYIEQNTNKCKKCSDTCATCIGPNANQCDKCYLGLSKFSDGTCQICKLEENKFIREVDNTCQNCHNTCSKCKQFGEDKCDECAQNLSYDNYNKCISCQKQKFYVKNRRCLPCHSSCLECKEEGITKCDVCEVNFKKQPDLTCATCKIDAAMYIDPIDDKCKQCHEACSTCKGGNQNSDCTACKNGYHFMYDNEQNISTSIKRCVVCPEEHYFKTNDGFCLKCHPSCKKCNERTVYNCISCEQQNHYFLDKICQECPDKGYYTEQDQCLKCVENCEKCSGNQIKDCAKCIQDYYFYTNKNDNSKLCRICPIDLFYVDGSPLTPGTFSKRCDDCHFSCQQCNGPTELDCIKCKDKLFFKEDKKCETCPPLNYFIDKDKCLKCDESCEQCNGTQANKCTKCAADKSFHFNVDPNQPVSDTNFRTCKVCQTENGYYKDSDTCKLCHSSCKSCSGPSQNQCISCIKGLYLYDDKTCSDCPQKKFYILNNTNCKRCHETCLQCNGVQDDNCIVCDNDLKFDKDKKCIDCRKDFFFVQNDQCLPCDKSCQKCNGKTPDDCTECLSDLRRMETNKRCEICPANEFFKTQKDCKKCHSTCLTCNSENANDCIKCKTGLHFSHDTHLCIECLKKGAFYIDEKTESCRPCSENCATCSSDSPSSCKSCIQKKYFDKNINEKNEGTCIKCDPKNFVENDLICKPCHPTCKTCSKGGNETDCEECEKDLFFDENDKNKCKPCDTLNGNFIFQNKYCRQCSKKCKSCEGPLDSDCLTCPTNEYFLEDFNYKKCGQCPQQNYFKEEQKQLCHKCQETCKICENKSEKCIKCIDTKYMFPDQTCKDCPKEKSFFISELNCLQCHPTCKECSGGSSQQCELCNGELKLTIKNECKTCLVNDGFFVKNIRCLECHSSCKTCDEEGDKRCKTCRENLYFHPDKTCKQCPRDNGYYLDANNICQQCHDTCKVCKDNKSSSCETCKQDLYFLDGLCQKCDILNKYFISTNKRDCGRCSSNCQTCQDEKKESCINCVNDTIFVEDTQECAKCLTNKGYYEKNTRCYKCHQSCETCRSGEQTQCIKCKDKLSFLDGYCVQCNLSEGFYIDESTNTCKKCSSNCQTCTEYGQDKCKTCKSGLYFNQNNICELCSDIGNYTKGDKCFKCEGMCLKCEKEANLCTECQNSLYLYIDKSCKQCNTNQGYFIDSSDSNKNKHMCLSCHQDCSICSNKDQNACIQCKYPYTFFDQKHICQNCHLDCKKCFGKNNNECEQCLDSSKYIKVSDKTCGKCENNEFHDEIKCFTCSENCLKCQKQDECLQCGNGTQIKRNNQCGKCESNEYIDINNRCQPCHQDCLTCNGSKQNECTLCNNQLLIRKDTQICGYCDRNQYDDKIKCFDCHSECSTCNGKNNNSDCLTCKDQSLYHCLQTTVTNFFIPMQQNHDCEKACLQCHKNCKTCFGSKETECMTCSFGILQKDLSCSKYCPDGKFFDEETYSCQACDQNCLKCTGRKQCSLCNEQSTLFKGVCFQCRQDQYIDEKEMMCTDCHESCKSCRNKTKFDCIECKNEEYFFDQFNKCVADCDEGYIKNKKVKRCQECLYQRRPNSVVECVLECDSNQYGDKATRFCKECINNCSRCTDIDKCTECKASFSFSSINKESCRVCNENEFVSDDNICVVCPQLNCDRCNKQACTKCSHTYLLNNEIGQCYYDQRYESYECKDLNKDDDSCEKEMDFIDKSDYIMKQSTIVSLSLNFFSTVFLGGSGLTCYTMQIQQIVGNDYFYKENLKTLSLGPTFYQQNYQMNILSIIPNPFRAFKSYRDFMDIKDNQPTSLDNPNSQSSFITHQNSQILHQQYSEAKQCSNISQHNLTSYQQHSQNNIYEDIQINEQISAQNLNMNNKNYKYLNQNISKHNSYRILENELLKNNLSNIQATELSKRTIDNFLVYILVMTILVSFFGICHLFRNKKSIFIDTVKEKQYSWLIMIQMIFSNYVMITVFNCFKNINVSQIHVIDIISIIIQVIYLVIYLCFALYFFNKVRKFDSKQISLNEVRVYMHLIAGIITDKTSTKYFWFFFEIRKILNLVILFSLSQVEVKVTLQLLLNISFFVYQLVCKPFHIIREQRYYYTIEGLSTFINIVLAIYIFTEKKEFAWIQYVSLVLLNLTVLSFTFFSILKIIYVRFFQKRFIITKTQDNEIDQKWREINKNKRTRLNSKMSPLMFSPLRKPRNTLMQMQNFPTLTLSSAQESASDINDLSIKWNMNPIYAREIALQEIQRTSETTLN